MSDREPEPEEDLDDEALHWEGDEARGQAGPRLRGEAAADAPAASASADLDATDTTSPRATPADTATTVGTFAFAAVYLALTVGWVLSVQLLGYPGLDLLGEVMWQFGEFVAMIAPALWFVATLALTPHGARRRGVHRFGWLLLGCGLLLPLPYLLGAFG